MGLVAYAYIAYPLLIWCVGRCWGRPVRRGRCEGGRLPSFSVVIAAFNEKDTIGRRVQEFTERLAADGLDGEVIVISDGSTDGTAAAAQAGGPARVIEFVQNRGKAASLNAGLAAAQKEVVVLADARQHWAPGALVSLLENFADPAVGAAGGHLELESRAGVVAGVGLYWRFEKWLRRLESRIHSTAGLTGAVCAVRRHLFRPVPAGTILDDVYWPLCVAMQGYRVVHDEQALAFDRLPEHAGDEFRRKVRTLAGNLQLLCLVPGALLPWRNPIWCQFLSHKLLRLVVPWALLGALAANLLLAGPFYRTLLGVQLGGYALALMGLRTAAMARFRVASAAASFLVLNAAAWVAFWVWISGRSSRSWRKVVYSSATGERHSETSTPRTRQTEEAGTGSPAAG